MTGLEAFILFIGAGVFLARIKDRSGWRWGIACLLCPPALIVLICLPDASRQATAG